MDHTLGNRIHPTAVVADDVELGDGNVVGPFAVIVGPVRIGSGNWIGPHVTIGTPASDRDAPHPDAWSTAAVGDPAADGHGVRIGDGNRIREYFSVHQGTRRPTTIGSGGYFLRSSHVAHDGVIGDDVTLSSNVVVGGHGHVGDWANLGLGVVVHQHGRIGPGAMVGMGAAVRHALGPFTVSAGVPARVTGVNTVGLRRRGVDDDVIAAVEPHVLSGESTDLAGRLPEPAATVVKSWAAQEGRDG